MKYGMIGGDLTSFIGGIHRTALRMDARAQLVCGCFSRNKEKNLLCGKDSGIPAECLFTDWRDMLAAEIAKGDDKIDFVAICTPNSLHYEMSKAFLEAGINVFCEKPLCFEVEEAEELKRIADEKRLTFGVPYTYTGNNMVKVLREMVQRGDIGDIMAIHARYAQDWLIDEVVSPGTSETIWRTVPKYSGISNAMGDIGTHLEYMIRYITGLKIKRLCAVMDRYGKALDFNDNVLIEYDNGVRGSYWVSQIAIGKRNGLKIEIYGTEGSLEWDQQQSEYAIYTPRGQAPRTISRGAPYLNADATGNCRIPCGHPEGFYCAFANIYRNFVSTVEKRKLGIEPTDNDLDFPTVDDGILGVRFVHAVVESDKKGSVWVDM